MAEHIRCQETQDMFLYKKIQFEKETLQFLIAHKEVMQWKERGSITLSQTKYVREIQNVKGGEEHGISLLAEEILNWTSVASHYQLEIVEESIEQIEEEQLA